MGSIDDTSATNTCPVPTFDFSTWTSSTTSQERLKAAKVLVEACREFGCVYITNLELPSGLVNDAFDTMKRLFELTHDEKMQAPYPDHSKVHRGYSYPGLEMVHRPKPGETNFTQDWREAYDIGSEENEEQPNKWLHNNTLPGFREFEMKFYWECDRVAKSLLTAVALGLGVEDPDDLLKFNSGQNNQLRLVHYPSLPVADLESEAKARLPAHCDFSTFTMLFSDDCGGLEFEDPKSPGEFFPVPPKEGAYLLSVGDFLMIWSNGEIPATSDFKCYRAGQRLADVPSRLSSIEETSCRSLAAVGSLRRRDESDT